MCLRQCGSVNYSEGPLYRFYTSGRPVVLLHCGKCRKVIRSQSNEDKSNVNAYSSCHNILLKIPKKRQPHGEKVWRSPTSVGFNIRAQRYFSLDQRATLAACWEAFNSLNQCPLKIKTILALGGCTVEIMQTNVCLNGLAPIRLLMVLLLRPNLSAQTHTGVWREGN